MKTPASALLVAVVAAVEANPQDAAGLHPRAREEEVIPVTAPAGHPAAQALQSGDLRSDAAPVHAALPAASKSTQATDYQIHPRQ